ncbi:hypothetical protein [uncultured Gimesia sp.]|uniref:hypothetical protein n=1 Tax=uncultured Gimesia sp. TaxID=1678688 RepID=UPI0026104084|nr:hypothetical protein [uncultured Gimesia sp.]
MAQAAGQKDKQKHKQGQSIEPQTLYSLEEFKLASGMGNWALRQARKAGLKMLKVGNRKFVRGSSFIDFLESTNGNSPEAV